MIDRAVLASLTPGQRAAVIYGVAQTELSRRLWDAALGDANGHEAKRLDDPARATARMSLGSIVDLLAWDPARVPTAPAQTPPAAVDSSPDRDHRPATPASGLAAGRNARHAEAIDAAAARTGIPAAALTAIIDAEAARAADGSWDVHSRNHRSSAAGLGQFLSGTWEGLARMKGTWLHNLAQGNGWLAGDGGILPGARAALLATRYDPAAAINSVADYARINLAGLRRAGVVTGSDPGVVARTAYIGHHLGLGDAIRFLRDGGLPADRARTVLQAQIGATRSAMRIAEAGDAGTAHRRWLTGYMDSKFRPERFAALPNSAI